MNKTNKKFYYFHIGTNSKIFRKNGGVKILKEELLTEDEVYRLATKDLFYMERDGYGKFYYMWTACNGNEIISDKDLIQSIASGRLIIEHDTIYNTDVFTTKDKMSYDELDIIESV